jgi:hypothetical protein
VGVVVGTAVGAGVGTGVGDSVSAGKSMLLACLTDAGPVKTETSIIAAITAPIALNITIQERLETSCKRLTVTITSFLVLLNFFLLLDTAIGNPLLSLICPVVAAQNFRAFWNPRISAPKPLLLPHFTLYRVLMETSRFVTFAPIPDLGTPNHLSNADSFIMICLRIIPHNHIEGNFLYSPSVAYEEQYIYFIVGINYDFVNIFLFTCKRGNVMLTITEENYAYML